MTNKLVSIRKEIFEKGRVLKNIDFSYDIDTELSDKYRIVHEKGYLEFLYKHIEAVKPEQYMAIVGKLMRIGDGAYAHAVMDDRIDDINYHSHVLLNRNLVEEQTEIMQVEFTYEKNSEVQLRFSNSYEYNLLSSFVTNSIALDSNSFSANNRKSFITMIKNNIINYIYREGNIFYPFFYESSGDNGKIKLLMDIKQMIILINSKKVNLRSYHNLSTEINYMTITCDSHEPSTQLVINNANLGGRNGYIYIKPFKIESDHYKIVFLSKGNPELQYYDYIEKKWRALSNREIKKGNIALRINMQSWERVYNIAVIESGY